VLGGKGGLTTGGSNATSALHVSAFPSLLDFDEHSGHRRGGEYKKTYLAVDKTGGGTTAVDVLGR